MTHLRFNGNGLGYYDDENQPIEYVGGEPIASSRADGEELVEELFTKTDYLANYRNTDSNLDILIAVTRKLNRHSPRPTALTVQRFLDAYAVAHAAGGECGDCGTLEKVPAPTPEAPRSRDDSGRFLNPHVATYLEMLNTPSVPASEITRKMRNDPEFAAAVEAWRNPKPAAREDIDPDEFAELRKFANDYRKAPGIRFIAGYTTIGDREYTKPELDAKVERAAEVGVL